MSDQRSFNNSSNSLGLMTLTHEDEEQKIVELEDEVGSLREKIVELKDKVRSLREKNVVLEEDVVSLKKAKKESDASLKYVVGNNELMNSDLEETKKRLRVQMKLPQQLLMCVDRLEADQKNFKKQIEVLQTEKEKFKKECDNLENQRVEYTSRCGQLNETLNKVTEERNSLSEEVNDLKKRLHESEDLTKAITSGNEDLNRQLLEKDTQIRELMDKSIDLQKHSANQKEMFASQREKMVKELNSYKDVVEDLKIKLEKINREKDNKLQQTNISLYKKTIDQLTQEKEDIKKKLTGKCQELEKTISDLKIQSKPSKALQECTEKNSSLEKEMRSLKELTVKLEHEKQSLEINYSRANEQCQELSQKKNETSKRIEDWKKSNDDLGKNLSEMRQKYEASEMEKADLLKKLNTFIDINPKKDTDTQTACSTSQASSTAAGSRVHDDFHYHIKKLERKIDELAVYLKNVSNQSNSSEGREEKKSSTAHQDQQPKSQSRLFNVTMSGVRENSRNEGEKLIERLKEEVESLKSKTDAASLTNPDMKTLLHDAIEADPRENASNVGINDMKRARARMDQGNRQDSASEPKQTSQHDISVAQKGNPPSGASQLKVISGPTSEQGAGQTVDVKKSSFPQQENKGAVGSVIPEINFDSKHNLEWEFDNKDYLTRLSDLQWKSVSFSSKSHKTVFINFSIKKKYPDYMYILECEIPSYKNTGLPCYNYHFDIKIDGVNKDDKYKVIEMKEICLLTTPSLCRHPLTTFPTDVFFFKILKISIKIEIDPV